MRVRRDPGGAPGTHPLIGSCTRMADDDALWVAQRLSRFEATYSPKYPEIVFSEVASS